MRKQSDARIAFLADRMAVMMVILKSRHDGWDWLYGEHMWEDDEGVAEELRDWPDYKYAKDIIKLWIIKHDKREEK